MNTTKPTIDMVTYAIEALEFALRVDSLYGIGRPRDRGATCQQVIRAVRRHLQHRKQDVRFGVCDTLAVADLLWSDV